MRLISQKERLFLLDCECNGLQIESDFYVPESEIRVNVFDGETKGMYEWLPFNYLKGSFDNLSVSKPSTYDFL